MKTLKWLLLVTPVLLAVGCGGRTTVLAPQSASGVKQAEVKVQTDSQGHTTEQRNVMERLRRDNDPGSVKHLYVISAYSGQVILYSPIRGKVTSSGKRLHPTTIDSTFSPDSGRVFDPGIRVRADGQTGFTKEMIQDDGTYGSSIEYLFWFTPDGRYHQHYLGGGQIVHVADQPISVKGVVITIESHEKK